MKIWLIDQYWEFNMMSFRNTKLCTWYNLFFSIVCFHYNICWIFANPARRINQWSGFSFTHNTHRTEFYIIWPNRKTETTLKKTITRAFNFRWESSVQFKLLYTNCNDFNRTPYLQLWTFKFLGVGLSRIIIIIENITISSRCFSCFMVLKY